jgi:hypothetical protein
MKFATSLATILLLPATLLAQTNDPGQVVGPSCAYTGDPSVCRGTLLPLSAPNVPRTFYYGQDVTSATPRDWWADNQGGFAEVTRTNPRAGWGGYDQGSLEMRVQGQNARPGSDEWNFWYRFAGGASYENSRSASFGTLGTLSALSFDWFRAGNDQSMDTSPSADWPYKTPVIRLRLLENAGTSSAFESELVWEGYYNKCSLGKDKVNCDNNTTPLNTWVEQTNMQSDKFWYARPPGAGVDPVVSSGGACGLIAQQGWSGGISAFSIATFTGGTSPCISGNTLITGIAVGIGSRWPLPYTGFADNVRMGFTVDGQYRQAVDVNFDFVPGTTVPEPSTWALMGAGLLALGVVARRRTKG